MVKILIMQDQEPDKASKLFCKNLLDSINDFLSWGLYPGGECEYQIRYVFDAKFRENKTAMPFPLRGKHLFQQ